MAAAAAGRSSSTPIPRSLLLASSPTAASASSSSPSSLAFRRAFSDGELPSLLHPDHSHHRSRSLNPASSLRSHLALATTLSFSVYASNDPDEEGEERRQQESPKISDLILHKSTSKNPRNTSDAGGFGAAGLPLFLARGLGIDRIGSGLLKAGGGGEGNLVAAARDRCEQSEAEMGYKRMVEVDPSNGLFLHNYARFLYQVKGDTQRAEEYYSRAILADPGNGEILSQYAQLIWEAHQDEERSLMYFEKAVQAAPANSNVLAAYAGFLWEVDEDEGKTDEGGVDTPQVISGLSIQQQALHSITLAV